MWKNMVERGRPQMAIWRTHIACWISKATITHSKYIILIAFPLQQWLHGHASKLGYTYSTLHVLLNCRFRPSKPLYYRRFFLSQLKYQMIFNMFEFILLSLIILLTLTARQFCKTEISHTWGKAWRVVCRHSVCRGFVCVLFVLSTQADPCRSTLYSRIPLNVVVLTVTFINYFTYNYSNILLRQNWQHYPLYIAFNHFGRQMGWQTAILELHNNKQLQIVFIL